MFSQLCNIVFQKFRKAFKNKINGAIAVYDSFMGLYYINGHKYNDGPMIPFKESELLNNEEWELLSEEDCKISLELKK